MRIRERSFKKFERAGLNRRRDDSVENVEQRAKAIEL